MPILPVCAALVLLSQPGDVPSRLRALESSKPLVEMATIGTSRQGRPIQVVWVTDPSDTAIAPADRATFMVVAGIDGRHRVGMATAVGVAERLIADHEDLLKSIRFAIIPCLNPDNDAWQFDGVHPKADFGRTLFPHDADHDGRMNEDPGEDLNGDGVISMMRLKNPGPASDLKAEFCIDPDNARLLKKPDAAKGQKAEYALLIEGTDNDGDGKFNEDGIGGSGGGGTDLNMNFPYRWPEFADGAGPYPLSEPESLAFGQWLIQQTNVAVVLAFTPGDTIITLPPVGKFDATGEQTLGIEEGDKAAYEEVAKLFKEATKMTGAPGLELAGSVTGWAYAHQGMLSISTPVWVRPDQVKKEEPKGDAEGGKKDPEKKELEKKDPDKPEAEAPQGGSGGPTPEEVRARIRAFMSASPAEQEKMMQEFNSLPPEVQAQYRSAGGAPPAGGGAGQPPGGGGGRQPGGRRGGGPPGGAAPPEEKKPDSDDAKWIKYDEDQVKAGAASGFLDWKPFTHPQLGDVEIGGFIPGFKLNPPEAELPRLADEQTKFITSLAAKFPKLIAQPAAVERLGPGLYRVSMRVVNEGAMASMPQVNTKARHGLPSLLTVEVPLDRLISGERTVRAWVIPGTGGDMRAEWIIAGEDGSAVDVTFRPSIGAKSTIRIELKEAAK